MNDKFDEWTLDYFKSVQSDGGDRFQMAYIFSRAHYLWTNCVTSLNNHIIDNFVEFMLANISVYAGQFTNKYNWLILFKINCLYVIIPNALTP